MSMASPIRRSPSAWRALRASHQRLYLSERTVETHVASILAKLDLANSEADHRRVLAVVAYLREAPGPSMTPHDAPFA